MQEPYISVGILHSKKINFVLFGDFESSQNNSKVRGRCSAEIVNNKIVVTIEKKKFEPESEVILSPANNHSDYFQLKDVVIGIQFHWERKEKQSFRGKLKFVIEDDAIWAINIVPLEEYLKSVISSEMSPKSSISLLKAHAVISRSWLLAQVEKSKKIQTSHETPHSFTKTDGEDIRWWDREDHTLFDVCADDHCQRYQGITKIHTENAKQSIAETYGLVLKYNEEICDARFSKSCGGISEAFEAVWENTHYPYLVPIVDYNLPPDGYNIDLRTEENAKEWILQNPHAFCNTNEKKILEQVLLEYDQETKDFYRWKVEYSQEQIQQLILLRTGIDFGQILDLIPVERGVSGRLIKLKIVGTKKTLTIGKELYIRKALSNSHLYSSAFVVEKGELIGNVPTSFTLIGAGWGHGVGLCQIGAAVMAEKGYLFDEILLHYYKNAQIVKIY
ncbi:MAG: SpoIID/LytB domain-containing protein [Ignavibacteria bacterium]|nr:SpoIID/LytB domain-containing protein [Ignavibacteria bacterium]